MLRTLVILPLLLGVLSLIEPASAQSRVEYDYAYIGDPLPDPLMQQNKETYVLYGCAYCHGLYLQPVGEATDLRTSALVGADVEANLIGPILRVGIPQTPKSSPMPQFSDLSDREIRAITTYIHYARADVRYTSLTAGPASVGDAAAGKTYVEQQCASCHRDTGALAAPGSDAAALRKQILAPAAFLGPMSFNLENRTALTDGRARHQALLENFAEADVANIVAYLETLN
ncbi:MAG: cytochrome c [Rhodothermales bacterium]|nr:cytochrome c [Rhodothermales bacterium]